MNNHYDNLAEDFDTNWMFSNEYRDWYTEKIINSLNIKLNDKVIDVGCGTGVFTKKIIDRSHLSSIVCIENSLNMCKEASRNKQIEVINSDANTYFKQEGLNIDKVLFKEVIHHIDDIDTLFKNIYSNMSNNGKLLIVTRPKKVEFPFFEKAHISFSDSQPDISLFEKELLDNEFKVEVFLEKYEIILPKSKWNKMLENRFMSNLSDFNDSEINQGILEINQKYNTDEYKFNDNLIFIVASK